MNEIVRSFSNLDRRTHWWNLTSSSSTALLLLPVEPKFNNKQLLDKVEQINNYNNYCDLSVASIWLSSIFNLHALCAYDARFYWCWRQREINTFRDTDKSPSSKIIVLSFDQWAYFSQFFLWRILEESYHLLPLLTFNCFIRCPQQSLI